MARASDTLGKKYNKLNAFLKKKVDADTFERIRATDSCIVCSENENKAFKFVILTDEWIYLTENPPKKVYAEVHLRDVQSIELGNDLPDFLVGDERENVQHIIIRHLAEFSGKKPKKSRDILSRNSPRAEGIGRSLSARSILSTRSDSVLVTHKSVRRISTMSDASESPRKVHFGGAGQNRDLKTNSLDARTLRDLGIGDDNASNKKSKKSKKFKKSKKGTITEEEEQGDMLKMSSSDLKLNLENLDDSVSLANGEMSSFSNLDSDNEEEGLSFNGLQDNIKETTLHLYIMDGTSPFLSLAKGAWNNYVIVLRHRKPPNFYQKQNLKGTMEEDRTYCLKLLSSTPRKQPGQSERMELLFTQLRTELLRSQNTMEDVFHLVNELKNAADKQFFIKKLFWKTSELFLFLIRQLKKYIPTSPCVVDSYSQANINQRADELEFVNLIFETLHLMFRETEILASRFHTLKMGKGKPVADLLVILLTQPQLPGGANEKPSSLGTIHLESHRPFFSLGGDGAENQMMDNLTEELTNHATSILYEIFLIAQQGMFQDGENFFTVEWIVKNLEDIEATTHFLERIIAILVNLVSPRDLTKLTPMEAILLYHQLAVLDTVLNHSEKFMQFVKQTFFEEFKYYVQVGIVRKKLPKAYTVRPHILDYFTDIISSILGRTVNFQ